LFTAKPIENSQQHVI